MRVDRLLGLALLIAGVALGTYACTSTVTDTTDDNATGGSDGGAAAGSGATGANAETGGANANVDVGGAAGEAEVGGAASGVETSGAAGDVEAGGASGGVEASGAGVCTPGQVRCNGSTPEQCSEEGQWGASRSACAIACLDGECAECDEGDQRCKDGAVQVCEANRWRTDQVCDLTCEAGECVEQCTEDRLQCSGDTLQRCSGGEYVDEQECDFLCQGDECAGECKPDSLRCNPDASNETQACNVDGQWDESNPCPESSFCVSGSCKPCEPGAQRCAETGPELCSAEGEWVPQGSCADPTPACLDGACVVCDPSQKRCNGNDLEQCEDDGSGWTVAETCEGDTPACIDSTEECGKCSEGDTQCDGDVVQSCNDVGAWETLTACTGSTPRCVAGECKACNPTVNERRCQDGDTAQACNADGSWGNPENCSGNTPLCREDLNFSCGCNEGDQRCKNASTPEKCVGGKWVAQSACLGRLDVCLPETGQCVDCAPNDETCNGNVAQLCSDSGSWESLGTCAGSQVNCGNCGLGEDCNVDSDCQTNACVNDQCAVCKPGAKSCSGVTPRLCSSDGTWANQTNCSGTTPICQGGNCVQCNNGSTRSCGNCDLGTQSCSNNSWGNCQNDHIGPSCDNTPTCGSDNESCCKAEWVDGGTYTRGTGYNATVSGFCLDKFEITVGRFREFIADYNSYTPPTGAGEHKSGAGTGWQSSWSDGQSEGLPASVADWEANVQNYCPDLATWRGTKGSANAERLPINCISWYEAFAFCIWDGGRLPTDAEWEYAAGGSQGWTYPWGNTQPNSSVHAVFNYCGDDNSCGSGNSSYSDILPVGSRPGGDGFFGQSDLAGNLSEWVFDVSGGTYPTTCNNCANNSAGFYNRIIRGGDWRSAAASLAATYVTSITPSYEIYYQGARCVRMP